MNDAARSCRAIDAPMLNDFGPHSAGNAGAMPAPSLPWQRAQLSVNSPRPRVESPTSVGHLGQSLAVDVLAVRHALRDVREIGDDVLHLAAVRAAAWIRRGCA